MSAPVIYVGRELPGLSLFWLNSAGDPVALNTGGYSFNVSIAQDGVITALPNVTVFANASPTVDTGSSADVPTLSLSFQAGSVSNLTAGPAVLRVVASAGGLDRLGRWDIVIAE